MDFHGFWSASFLASRGNPAGAHDPSAHRLVQESILRYDGFTAFFYPPPYPLLCYPLAPSPVKVSGAAWPLFTTVTGAPLTPIILLASLVAIWRQPPLTSEIRPVLANPGA